MKKRFASGAEKRTVRRCFQEAGTEQRRALDSFLQKREDESSGNTVEAVVEKDADIAER